MGSASNRRLLLGLPLLGALAVAACQPVSPGPPSSSTPTSVPGCGATTAPTDAHPIEYVAVVDKPGPENHDVVTFTAKSQQEKNHKLDEARHGGTVIAVDPNQPVSTLAVDGSDDPNYASGQQYGLGYSGFPTAWSNGYDGTGVTIAIVDTGVTASHEDLTGKVLQGADFVPGSNPSPQGDSNYAQVDFNGHGTHVAGIAAANDNTVGGLGGAPRATILPVRVLDANGSGYDSWVVNGIYWATDHGANVISLSLGGGGCSSAEHAAVDYAEAHGVVVVAAAGNNNSSTPIYPAGFGSAVIAVGATDQSNAKASYSNWGSPYVDLGAPGSGILSTYKDESGKPVNGNYKYLSGTSMATPFVSAAVALVLEKCPTITNGDPAGSSVKDKVMSLLQSTASPAISGLGASLVQAGAATNPSVACPA